jgi:MoxR-like ATPase
MDRNSKDLFNLYRGIINEAGEMPFAKQNAPLKKQPPVTNLQQKAADLKSKTQDMAAQVNEPSVSSDAIAQQAAPLIAAANKEVSQLDVVQDDPTSLVDIPRLGSGPAVAWKETEFPEMSIAQVEEHIEAAYMLKKAFLLIGDPGRGKSQIHESVARRIADEKGREYVNYFDTDDEERQAIMNNPANYFVFVDIRLADMDKSDMVGVPKMSDKPYTTYSPPQWVVILTTPGADGLLFLDEFNQGTKEVKDAAFKVCLDRVLGDKRMAKDVGVSAACNMGELYGNEPIAPANINRFGGGVLVVNDDEWLAFAERKKLDETIIAFVRTDAEDVLFKEPNGENPFVTPRQLEVISDYIKYFRVKFDKMRAQGKHFDALEHIKLAAAGRAGTVWANKFDTFLEHIQSFDMKKILKNPASLANMPLDKCLALLVFVNNKIKKVVDNAPTDDALLTPDDFAVLEGIAKICNHLSKETVCVLISNLRKSLPVEKFTRILDFWVEANYDPKVKQAFLSEVLPEIKKILKGDGSTSK